MRVRKLFSLTILLVLLTALTGAAGGAPLAGVCIPGGAYDPACDVDHDGDVDIFDVQLTAGHWSQNGVYVSDNNHNHLGQTWTGADNPITIQGSFAGPALTVNNSAGLGLRVGTGGLNVSSAVDDGVLVGTVGGDGVYIYSAGENGVRISSAGGYGLIVGHTAYDGVFIVSADSTGLNVQLAETGAYVASAGWNGMVVEAAGGDGMRVVSATYNGVYANTTQASGEWGFYTPDKIHGSNVLLESVSLVAQVSGAESLTAGDLVMAAGIADPLPGSTVHLPQVQAAAGAPGGVIGVVEGRLALTARPRPASALGESAAQASELHRAEGPAQPGDYVALTVAGAARVRVSAADGPVTVGQRLTVADLAGHARALRTRTLDGMIVSEGAAVIGTALEPLAAGEGLIWVLVNVQ
ncbi:hypothetical protein [Candidatus Amarolinea dominans]|uniref:hypothetical protein n=1 Tax=Candidatus Amarolinea dominans TaxID=3140696 RepID=UPI003135FCF3|nr:hypothetical protein [Anaerolineae bacterium]